MGDISLQSLLETSPAILIVVAFIILAFKSSDLLEKSNRREELKIEFEKTRDQIQEKAASRLSSSNETLGAAVNVLQETVKEAMTQRRAAETRVGALEAALTALKEESVKQAETVRRLEKSEQESAKKIAQLESENTRKAERISCLERDLDAIKADRDEVARERDELKKTVAELRSELNELKAEQKAKADGDQRNKPADKAAGAPDRTGASSGSAG